MNRIFRIRESEHYDYPQLSIFEDYNDDDSLIIDAVDKDVDDRPSVMYIHIPFCKNFCVFCNYYKVLPKNFDTDYYKKSLIKEINYYAKLLPMQKKVISAIHFGGGTPSLLPISFYEEIFNEIKKDFFLLNDCLISFEGNIKDFSDEQYLKELKNLGVNRISFGVQSFDENIRNLYFLPDKKLIYKSIENANKNNLYDYNVDLMYNFPEQNPDMIISDIEKCFELDVNCIDLYALNVFPHTAMERYLRKNNTIDNFRNNETLIKYQKIYQYIAKSDINLVMSNTISKHSKEPNKYLKYHLGNNEKNSTTIIGVGPSSRGYISGVVYKNYSNLSDYCNNITNNSCGRHLMKLLTDNEKENRLLVMFPNFTFLPKKNLQISEHNKIILNELIKQSIVLENDENYYISKENCFWAGNISNLFYSDKQSQKMNRTTIRNFKEKLNMYNQDKMIILDNI